ncbi:SGNH/GDSL hydrolase family protein [Xylophilus sp. GOD-11R]|uniref:SGNH/GDSL hydrolase family protein n=1 Tax=Xylophilus sp. GOD-11R TaxID=3089814 RepID=UPI00298CA998|nr:SGNH/GDSL hydrolase family protein [Xylophilus sp. GOD-11R]WPB58637.1 SGNH/GDSL hydrolase family protein [Xylophilus sp. GOD-11R]
MSDIAQGARTKLIIKPGEVYRIGTSGAATVVCAYGDAPATSTVAANTQAFGPYTNQTKIVITANTRRATITRMPAETTIAATISGSIAVGQTVQAIAPSGFTATGYQWHRTVNGTKTSISGATASTYLVASTDAGAVVGCDITGTATAAGALVAAAPSPGPKTGSYLSRFGTNYSSAPLQAAGNSMGEQKPVGDYPYTALRVTLHNYSTADIVLDNVQIASAPADLHNGVGLGWQRATVNGNTTITIPAATLSGTGSSLTNKNPGLVTLDQLPVASVARTDTPGAPFLVQLRADSTGVISITGGPITRTNESKPYLGDRGYVFGFQQIASKIAANTSLPLTLGSGLGSAGGLIGSIEAITGDAKHFPMALFADSLTAGYSGTSAAGQIGWPNMVIFRMRQTGKIGALANYAVGGKTQDTFIKDARAYVAQNKPAAVFVPAWSPNSNSSQVAYDGCMANFQAFAADMIAAGVVVYTATAMPTNSVASPPTTANNNIRVNFNAALKAFCAAQPAGKVICLDFSAVVEDPAVPGAVLDAYNYDNTHQNPTGQQAIADYVSTQLGL